MTQYPRWKYWLVIAVLVVGTIFALPNVFGEGPALELARNDRQAMDSGTTKQVLDILAGKKIAVEASYPKEDRLVVRFATDDERLKAREAILGATEREFGVALTNAPRMPAWMRNIGLKPMSLGLDLRGGVHFLYEVDVEGAVTQALERMERDYRRILREQRISYVSVVTANNVVRVSLRNTGDTDAALKALRAADQTAQFTTENAPAGGEGSSQVIVSRLPPDQIRQRQDFAIQQNITTLRNRVDELGVSEPVVTRQGVNRIVVQLPGVQDPNEAIRVLGATASLEFRLVDEANDPGEAERTRRVPLTSKLYKKREGGVPILLKRDVIASGDQLTDATSSYSEGQPAVNVRLDSRAGAEMLKTTQQNIGHRMAVVYIEKKRLAEGERCDGTLENNICTEEEVVSDAVIRGVFSTNFQITGLLNAEARELALLLRAGSLVVPNTLIEQRTVGPSLGQDNIDKGWHAMLVGLVLTFIFMAVYYRAFGWVANAVLLSNLVLTVGLLSMLQASLSLPGIAAVVFHLGIAVDANILIYERIREELRNGMTPHAAINAGFEKAFATIADSNVTTLIAGVVLFAFGTGTIRSFAIVMTLGILTSLFTSVVGSRALVQVVWGRRRRIEHLPI